ncbi:hypothetical protein [Dyadobacter bucti]|uniref:hypothetical protein n=1 Tax=Dyadobacter bucti TaxID=2572203 RepID=UPI001108BDAF|nr:hypothetical protein [Dyadobacter bucti]
MSVNALQILILLLLCSQSVLSQVKFSKTELYTVWLLAEEKLENGKFEEAGQLYKLYPNDPTFILRSEQVKQLSAIKTEGEKLLKKRQYVQALEKFKEYRKLDGIGTIGYLEKRIERCLEEVNKTNRDELTVQQRIITGFEFAHRGRAKLSALDTAGAHRDFATARRLGGKKNNILTEQVIEGFRVLAKLAEWSKQYDEVQAKGASDIDKLNALVSYHEIRNIDLPKIEIEIKAIKSRLSGNYSIAAIAKNCDLDLLVSYVETNRSTTNVSELALSHLRDMRSTIRKIDKLSDRKSNSETVKSAYESLLVWSQELPDTFRGNIDSCIREKQAAYLMTLEPSESTSKKNCPGLSSYNRGIALARRELANCNLRQSKTLLNEAIEFVKDCDQTIALSVESLGIRDSLELYIRSDSLLRAARASISQLDQKDCNEATRLFVLMSKLKTCDPIALKEEVSNGLANLTNCGRLSWWRLQLVANGSGIKPRLKTGDTSRDMGIGWAGSAGIELSYIDHKNIVEFAGGVQYFNTYFYSNSSSKTVQEDFDIRGASGSLSIKIHFPDTDPNKIRAYLKFGPEIQIPLTYRYKNYSTSVETSDVALLQRSILFATGGIGAEIQRKKFGAYVEVSASSSLGNLYRTNSSHLSVGTQKIETNVSRLGISVGVRFW